MYNISEMFVHSYVCVCVCVCVWVCVCVCFFVFFCSLLLLAPSRTCPFIARINHR